MSDTSDESPRLNWTLILLCWAGTAVVLGIVVVVVLATRGESEPPVSAAAPPKATPAPAVPMFPAVTAPDPARVAFKAALKEYLADAKAACNVIDLGLSYNDLVAAIQKGSQSLARIPDGPDDAHEALRKEARGLHLKLDGARDSMRSSINYLVEARVKYKSGEAHRLTLELADQFAGIAKTIAANVIPEIRELEKRVESLR